MCMRFFEFRTYIAAEPRKGSHPFVSKTSEGQEPGIEGSQSFVSRESVVSVESRSRGVSQWAVRTEGDGVKGATATGDVGGDETEGNRVGEADETKQGSTVGNWEARTIGESIEGKREVLGVLLWAEVSA